MVLEDSFNAAHRKPTDVFPQQPVDMARPVDEVRHTNRESPGVLWCSGEIEVPVSVDKHNVSIPT